MIRDKYDEVKSYDAAETTYERRLPMQKLQMQNSTLLFSEAKE